MNLKNKCFCGANKSFSSCCQPFIVHTANNDNIAQPFPQTPEKLMRSRFSAYATGNSQYIYDTYAKSSQISQSVVEIDDWGKTCLWIALKIHSINSDEANKNESAEQFVEFSAFYIADDSLCELRENSRFVLEELDHPNQKSITEVKNKSFQWRYLDGDIIEHRELHKIKRKDICPCNKFSTAWALKKGKKYKQCCGK